MQPSIVIKKAGLLCGSLNRVIAVSAILVAGCAPDRDAANESVYFEGNSGAARHGKQRRNFLLERHRL